jgi:hypothetical protein
VFKYFGQNMVIIRIPKKGTSTLDSSVVFRRD